MPLLRMLLVVCMLTGAGLVAQEQKAPEPPEEDETLVPKEYAFNPLQAAKELKVGNFYFKKRNYRAAAARYREATKWNKSFAEAHRRLGEALEKWKGLDEARAAYKKYLELEPNGKHAKQIRKKLAGK